MVRLLDPCVRDCIGLTSSKAIRKFKVFLETIVYPPDDEAVPRQRAILQEYLDSQRPTSNDEEAVFLPNIMEAWSFAAQANSDKLFTAASAIVALLLKALSNHIDFREHALLLCKTVLQKPQLRLVSRGLSSAKNKEYLISPCLRVLTEVVCFDGGVLARHVWQNRDLTMDMNTLGRNLTVRKALSKDPEEDMRKPAVRTNAVRYLLANFKFQSTGARVDILRQANVMRALIDGIEQDPLFVIADVVSGLKTYIVHDRGIPPKNKSYVFNDRNLYSLCQLYRVDMPEFPVPESKKTLPTLFHELMLDICASAAAGVVRTSGWYPPNQSSDDTVVNEVPKAHQDIDLGLDSLEWYGKFTHGMPIKNHTLGEFILTLRPAAYDMERQLLMAIFEAAPELVAYFFYKISSNFSFAPKLTATWIGYAAFMFSTVQLPVPKLYSRYGHLPPPIGVVIESILPQPLSQKVLHQCIVNSSDLVKFFATRILTVAFQKLKSVLKLFHENAESKGHLWEQASEKLVAEFTRRCPVMKDITSANNALRNASSENLAQREAVARLLSLYYEVTPQVALDQKYDISLSLSSTFSAVEAAEEGSDKELLVLELSHLVKIAHWSPSTSISWWKAPTGHKFSPFISLLRLIVNTKNEEPKAISSLLDSIVRDCGALEGNSNSGLSGLDCLIVSLKTSDGFEASDAVFEFVDDCFQYFVRKPIKYEDDKDAIINENHAGAIDHERLSLIWMTIIEQWPFVAKKHPGSQKLIARWIARFRYYLLRANENPSLLDVSVMVSTDAHDPEGILLRATNKLSLSEDCRDLDTFMDDYRGIKQENTSKQDLITAITKSASEKVVDTSEKLPAVFDLENYGPHKEDAKHSALLKITRKDAASSAEEGDLSTLIEYLSSPDLSIRRQTVTSLRNYIPKLASSTYIEKDQLDLFLNELLETASPIIDNGNPFPALAATWAARSVKVLVDPTHVMYEKVNEYMNLGPAWRVGKMASYFTEQILLHPPTDEADGSYWREVLWLLEWIEDGIRSIDDIEPLRRHDIFERLFSLFSHPALNGYGSSKIAAELFLDKSKLGDATGLQGKVRPVILRIVARVVTVGGAETLVTRCGVLAWLGVVKGMGWIGGDEGKRVVVELERCVLKGCKGDRVGEWSRGAIVVGGDEVA
jgi:nucleolar pre-ribosomal-associated protein 1